MTDRVTWVWVPDAAFTVLDDGDSRRCRFPRCENPAVAILWRRHGRSLPRPWAYCSEHLYGRRIIDGVVHGHCRHDSPAAKRGYLYPIASTNIVRGL